MSCSRQRGLCRRASPRSVSTFFRLFWSQAICFEISWRTGGTSGMKPVLLGREHRHYLSPPGQLFRQSLSFRVGQGAQHRFDCLAKVSNHLCIQAVGLCQPARSPGEFPHLAGIDYYHGQLSGRQGSCHRKLQASCRLKHHQGRSKLLKLAHQGAEPLLVVNYAPLHTIWSHGYVQMRFGHIDAYIRSVSVHWVLCSFLAHPCMIRAHMALTTVRALGRSGRDDQALQRSRRPRGERSVTSIY